MPIAVGSPAPDFTLKTKTADGPKDVKLSDNFGKTQTVLLFFPAAFLLKTTLPALLLMAAGVVAVLRPPRSASRLLRPRRLQKSKSERPRAAFAKLRSNDSIDGDPATGRHAARDVAARKF